MTKPGSTVSAHHSINMLLLGLPGSLKATSLSVCPPTSPALPRSEDHASSSNFKHNWLYDCMTLLSSHMCSILRKTVFANDEQFKTICWLKQRNDQMYVCFVHLTYVYAGAKTPCLALLPNHHGLPPSPPRQRASSQRHCCVQGLHDASEGLELTLHIKMKIDRIDSNKIQ